LEIDMPEARLAQVNGKIRSVDAEYSSSTGDRFSDSKEFQEDGLR
jgi:hypothetical protein